MRKTALLSFGAFVLVAFGSGIFPASGQSGSSSQASGAEAIASSAAPAYSSSSAAPIVASTVVQPSQTPTRPFSSVGVGVKLSSLGIGIEAATPLSQRTNLRADFNILGYSQTFNSDGINYAGTLTLRSLDALLDWYPFKGSFHISPGAMLYNGNQVTANASVPGDGNFTLNGINFFSDPSTPVTGTASLKFNPVAPMVLAGWGNLAPRSKHFSIPFEAGAVFQGSPRTLLNLTGNICEGYETNCAPISSNPGNIQGSILAQQTKLSNDVSALKYYPVISVGFAYRFSLGAKASY